MKKNKDFFVSTGNVFGDLDTINAEKKLAKAELAYQINMLIKKKELTQEEAAKVLGVDQSKISLLNKGKLAGFSLERLFRFLNALDQKITITIAPKKKQLDIEKNTIVITLHKIKRNPMQQKSKSSSRALNARKKK